MHRIINNASLLLGRNLTFIDCGFIEIGKDGIIVKAGAGKYNSKTYGGNTRHGDSNNCAIMDSEGLLIIPGLINAHTHIGDSFGKDILVDSAGVDSRVHPVYGAKSVILQKSRPDHLKTFMRSSAISMMKKGIVAFADFREGGCQGVNLLKDAIYDLPIKCIIFGRIEYYFDLTKKLRLTEEELVATEKNTNNNVNGKEMKNQRGQYEKRRGSDMKLPSRALHTVSNVLKVADGLGISGANENTDSSFQQYNKLLQDMNRKTRNKDKNKKKKKLLVAIHAAESKNAVEFSKSITGKTEVTRIIQYLKPDIVIHMTNATDDDISLVAKKRTGVIVCPRANGILGVGIPKVAKMSKSGCIIGIGTDNVMLNSPDIFRELDYIWKASRSIEPEFISARDILKMPTINNAEILGLNSGCIEAGRSADLIFIDKKHLDLYPIHNPYASIIHRTSQDCIKGVMIDGKIVDGAEL